MVPPSRPVNTVDVGMDDEQPPRPASGAAKDMFERLAGTAENIAETANAAARVHDQLTGLLPGAAEHAARERRLAAAEAEAADAYRNQQVPPDEVRQVIRDSGRARPRTSPQRHGQPPEGAEVDVDRLAGADRQRRHDRPGDDDVAGP